MSLQKQGLSLSVDENEGWEYNKVGKVVWIELNWTTITLWYRGHDFAKWGPECYCQWGAIRGYAADRDWRATAMRPAGRQRSRWRCRQVPAVSSGHAVGGWTGFNDRLGGPDPPPPKGRGTPPTSTCATTRSSNPGAGYALGEGPKHNKVCAFLDNNKKLNMRQMCQRYKSVRGTYSPVKTGALPQRTMLAQKTVRRNGIFQLMRNGPQTV